MNRILATAFVLLCVPAMKVMAQERCGAVEDHERMKREHRIPEDDSIFERWLLERKLRPQTQGAHRAQAGPYRVPVVVHIVHNGEPIGSGTNISDAQVHSQIRVLNEDFNRTNADAINTPSEFAAVAGSMDIEFVLARQDPEGLATNGIVRVKGTKTEWRTEDNYELKSLSYWPAENYFNIWVCNFTSLLGSAQFPESDLPGLGTSSQNALTDGIIIWYGAFGSIDDDDGTFELATDYDRGRTATHETGHFLGLRHIWGDDGNSCSGTDYVADTPNQYRNSLNCPQHPHQDNCSDAVMFQNYMDYTDDRCMNLFTEGQVERMTVVIENSPRRASLLTSPGLEDPSPVPNDLGTREIVTPQASYCSTTLTPVLEVKNYGSNHISSARIRFTVNGSTIETRDVNLDLDYLESTTVTFDPVNTSSGTSAVQFEVLMTNGTTDGNANNNIIGRNFFIPESISIPFAEDFLSLPPDWTIKNPDQQITWQVTTAPASAPANRALFMNFFSYDQSFGEVDVLLSPVFDLSGVDVASVIFDVSYAQYQGSRDRLKVIALRNCEPLETGLVLFDKEGDELATVVPPAGPFIPSGAEDWRKELVNMKALVGESQVQLAFVAISDYGNNLYLDNIAVTTSEIRDLTLTRVISPSVVTCDASPAPNIVVQNSGNVDIASFGIRYKVNAGDWLDYSVTGMNLQSGKAITIVMPPLTLAEGPNSVIIDLHSPNGLTDSIPSNDSLQFVLALNTAADHPPLRQDFESSYDDWTIVNPTGGMNWEPVSTNYGTSLFFDSFNNPVFGDEAWLVSPALDFSNVIGISMVFDLGFSSRQGRSDVLRVFVSKDCGNTYQALNASFAPTNESPEWVPDSPSDWQEPQVIYLGSLAGLQQARVALVVENANANNVYIDNIEFFTTFPPGPLNAESPFSIYGYDLSNPSNTNLKITFNLAERAEVLYSVVDLLGRVHAQGILHDVLNQTYPLFPEVALAPGVYIVRIKIGDHYYHERVIVPR